MNLLLPNTKIIFDLPDANLEYYPGFFSEEEANALLCRLTNEIPWQQDLITIFGKTHLQPRLTALFGNDGKPYSYSNITMHPHLWNELLLSIKHKVEIATQENFTSVLLNLYRDGKDSNGWHADNEKELGPNPVIASVSFGEKRVFQMKHNHLKGVKQNIILENGSLLLMKETTQHYWKHQIPKTKKPINPRINLTFRTIL